MPGKFYFLSRLGDSPGSAQVYHLCSPLTYGCQRSLDIIEDGDT